MHGCRNIGSRSIQRLCKGEWRTEKKRSCKRSTSLSHIDGSRWYYWENRMKLALSKSQYLSLRGRLILIYSVLDSLLTYVMPKFPLPSKVIKALGRMRRNFLWHGNKEAKGFNLVKWEIVQQNKEVWGSKTWSCKTTIYSWNDWGDITRRARPFGRRSFNRSMGRISNGELMKSQTLLE